MAIFHAATKPARNRNGHLGLRREQWPGLWREGYHRLLLESCVRLNLNLVGGELKSASGALFAHLRVPNHEERNACQDELQRSFPVFLNHF